MEGATKIDVDEDTRKSSGGLNMHTGGRKFELSLLNWEWKCGWPMTRVKDSVPCKKEDVL